MILPNNSEKLLYPNLVTWFQKFLKDIFRSDNVFVYDTRATKLSKIIISKGLQKYFDSNIWQTYDFRIDIAGFVIRENRLDLSFIECKTTPISLTHISKIIGYCQLSNPLFAYLLSTKGIGATLNSLIMTHNRSDILEYHWEKGHKPRRILLAKWSELTKNIEFETLLPPGAASNLGILK